MSFLRNVRPNYIPPFLANKDDLQVQREIILQHVLNTTLLFSIAAVLYGLYRSAWQMPGSQAWLLGALLLILLFATLNRRLPFGPRASLVLLLLAAAGVLDLLVNGLGGSGVIYLLTFAVLSGSLFGIRRGVIALAAACLSLGGLGWLSLAGRIQVSASSILAVWGPTDAWTYNIFAWILCAIILSGGVFQLAESLADALKEARLLARNLDQERDQLELHVRQRTNELARRASQLEAARQVAAKIAAQTDLEALLKTTVEVIRDQFDFYHAGVFLPDENYEYAVLRAATGEAGRVMLANHHRLKIGEVGIVGYVMSQGEPRITGDVAEDPAHYVNPVLPETRSEMAVPLKLGDQIVGALDVQSTRRNAFTAEDVDVLLTIADQLSAALEKARLLDQYQKSVDELSRRAQESTRQAWLRHLRNSRGHYAYRYRQMQVEPFSIDPREMEGLLNNDATAATRTEGHTSVVRVPIKLRGQILGVVNLRLSSDQVTGEMVELIENAVERMALSLETVRLLEEIQARSERERLVGDIAAKVRAATDIDTILRTTANELGRSLGVAEVLVQLAPGE